MKQHLSDASNSELSSLHIIDHALTTAREEAEKVDHIFLSYLLRLAHKEALDILESVQDASWTKPG